MSARVLQQLPAPPVGRTGWPWTEAAPPVAALMADGRPWPRITVVTPSYNQARFLEETIRSVLLQGYPALEYVVLDGGSSDGSVEIIRKYAPCLSYWRSQPDAGQAAAVAEGWQAATGDIVAYLNSDDIYLPDAIATAVEHLANRQDAPGVAGAAVQIDEHGRSIGWHRPHSGTFDELLNLEFLPQPAVFVRKSAVLAAGGIDTGMEVAFDLDLWLRVAHGAPFDLLPDVLAATRLHTATVTARRRPDTGMELERIARKLARLGLLTRRQQARLRGSVAFVQTSIAMDNLPRSLRRVVATALKAGLRHPPTGWRLARAAIARWGRPSATRPHELRVPPAA
jgi:hypothetical protein